MGYRRRELKDDLASLREQMEKVLEHIEEEKATHKQLREALAASEQRLKFLDHEWRSLAQDVDLVLQDLKKRE
jgi:septal ring factor EnvC (AmiA/AmiB activator)